MTKTRTPFFSLGARGSVGRSITAQRRGSATLFREKPLPSDPFSLPQAYQRWLYEDYAYLWTKQNAATKQTYATAGSRFHLTGFQYWMKAMLSTLPNISALYHLDTGETITAIDFSKNSNHGAIFGASPTDGLIDGSFYFDGLNDYVNCGNDPTLRSNQGTWECFHRFKNFTNTWGFISMESPGFNLGDSCLAYTAAGKVGFMLDDGIAERWITTDIAMNDDDWHHYAALFGPAGMQLYVDGVKQLQVNAYAGGTTNSPSSLSLGARRIAGWYSDGYLDMVIIHDTVLDPTEILRKSLRRYPAQ